MMAELAARTRLEIKHNIRIERIQDDLVFVMPGFIHDFGDPYHHESMMRAVELGEYGYMPGSGPAEWKFVMHEVLDDYVFYPINNYLNKRFGDGGFYQLLRSVLGFFWGLNCNFPTKDVILYTAWDFRGCPAVQVLKKRDGKWVDLNPTS